MHGIFIGTAVANALDPATPGPSPRAVEDRMRVDVRELQHQIDRLQLMNQALWELVRSRLSLQDEDLAALAQEIDMRDGVEDGRMTARAVRCPSCSRVSNNRHFRCMYCGQDFERPMFG